ncbi:hypothetical protein FSP39_024528 [Pinctada imbricata]|uniref:Reverse transcriptase domain-containing protein n=1 Tax=Pinctada imbricata TaxID=66713 RepID=A0AA88YFP7_PINIB|nr:hypothetical protein FSP39_024528 [Pinctada imbricata]
MLNFLIDNIFVVFGGKVFQQIVGIPMGTNCAPLLADIFLYSYEAEFIQSLVSEGKRYLASDFNFTYRYIDDVLPINNPKFADYLSSIYPSELEVKETTETNNSASYLDIMLSYDTDGHMNTSLYDKRDDFNFSITNFPFLSGNIPSSPAYGVFILNAAIATLKPTNASSVFNDNWGKVSEPVNGVGLGSEGQCLGVLHTETGDLAPWWRVDLADVYNIVQIVWIGKQEPDKMYRQSDIEIVVGANIEAMNQRCAYFIGPAKIGFWNVENCPPMTTGQYVQFQKPVVKTANEMVLELCEVVAKVIL